MLGPDAQGTHQILPCLQKLPDSLNVETYESYQAVKYNLKAMQV